MNTGESSHKLTNRFISIVRQSYRDLVRKHKIALIFIPVSVILLGLVATGILEALFYLSNTAKIISAAIILLCAAGVFIYYRKYMGIPTFKDFYRRFGKTQDKTKLSNALDLYLASKSQEQAPLHAEAIKQNLAELETRTIKSGLNTFSKKHPIYSYYRNSLWALLTTLTLLVTLILLRPQAMNRLAHMWITYAPPNPFTYSIEPGTLTLERGETIVPAITFKGDIPEQLSLKFKTDIEEEYRTRNPISWENQQASFSPIALTTNGSYFFEMDGFQTKKFKVHVQLRPRLEKLVVHIVPPAYTRLDTNAYTYPFSKIQAYSGSKVEITGITNKPVSQLRLHRTNVTDTLSLSPTGKDSTGFAFQWAVEKTDTVWFSMTDSAGLSNKNKFQFVLNPREDQHPFVNLTSPSEDIDMKNPEKLLLQYEAGDDFGLTAASLHYELQRAFTDEPVTGSSSLPKPGMNESEDYLWDIPALDPKPRDRLTYWIQVRDNDGYNGAKIGRSQKRLITFPSMTEYVDELESRESEVTQSLDSLSQSFDRMQQEYDQFKRQLKQNPETNWEQKQQLEDVEEERKKIDQQVEELNKKFESIRKEIEKSQMVSPETMKAYDELQKLMKEINDPELQKALEKLRNSLGKMDPAQMRKALQNYEFNEEQYKQRIKRTMELFKSLKLNSDLEKLARSFEELAEQEKQLSESTQSPVKDLEQQQAIENDLRQTQQKLQNLDENAPSKAKEQIKELHKNTDQQVEKIKNELRQNMEQLKEQQQNPTSNPEAKQQQRQIQKQLQQMAQQLRSAKQKLNKQRIQVNMAALEYVLYSLINLSTNQEELTRETENLPPRSQAFVNKARKERNISGQFSMLSDSLFAISGEIPGFSNKINKKKAEVEDQLSRAVSMLAERDKSNAIFAQRQSLGGVNELSTMVASLLDQLQNQQQSGSGGGMSMQQFMEQLQKMSGKQQQLNQQIQQMINDMQGDRLSQDQMKRLNQLSRQQNNIRKQLKELQQKGQLESGDRVLSELQRMSEQMEDAINDIRGGQLDRQLMQRQQNILSRMLSAEKAVQERGKEDRREATTAEERPSSVPPEVTLEQLQQRIRKMLNDPNRTKFTEDYQRLIEQYFELLKKEKKKIIQ